MAPFEDLYALLNRTLAEEDPELRIGPGSSDAEIDAALVLLASTFAAHQQRADPAARARGAEGLRLIERARRKLLEPAARATYDKEWTQAHSSDPAPRLGDVAPVNLGVLTRNQAAAGNLTLQNVGGGVLFGTVEPKVAWLDVTPCVFTVESSTELVLTVRPNELSRGPFGSQYALLVNVPGSLPVPVFVYGELAWKEKDGAASEKASTPKSRSRLLWLKRQWPYGLAALLGAVLVVVTLSVSGSGRRSVAPPYPPQPPIVTPPPPKLPIIDGPVPQATKLASRYAEDACARLQELERDVVNKRDFQKRGLLRPKEAADFRNWVKSKSQEARRLAAKAKRLDPSNVKGYLYEAQAAWSGGSYDEAISLARAARERFSTDADLEYQLNVWQESQRTDGRSARGR